MTPRAFRFGVTVPAVAAGPAWAERARRVEQLGYSILQMPDHFREQLAPVPALTAAALATTRLRIGSLVFSNDFRHPVALAKEAATLDVLSGGRFELGLGSGWLREEYDQAGIPFDAPGTRIERMAEAVTLVKGLLAGEPVHFTGRHYSIAGLRGTPTPIQRPHPPLVIGGGGERLLSLAAREASIVSLVPRARRDGGGLDRGDFGEAAFRQKIEWVRAAAGDRLAALELHTLIQAVVVTDRRAVAAEQLATRFKIAPELVLESPYVLCGTVEEICETLRRRRQTHGISYVTVFDRDLEVFAPVVERLAAT
ncbi:MAG TPA: TIGR03621 family F420-dependent LLM class oxidoreductase [Methylomirabilota bacterium]|nr:TIGR03621 family F420-dependent LLM class oxidoreductase [Methylomirabilota bacterium]